MAGESPPIAAESKPVATSRPMTRRRKRKLMLVAMVVVIAAIVVLWGWSATGAKNYLQVASIVDDSSGGTVPAKYLNRTIEVQGVILNWVGLGDLNFSLADKSDSLKSIRVELVGPLPSEFANGKTAVVKGELGTDLPLILTATEVTMGCASRY